MDVDREAAKEWIACLTFMWDAIGKPVEQNRLDAYVRTFKSVPIGILEKAVERAIANNGVYNVIPTPGALWTAVRKEIGDGRPDLDVMDAIEQWKDRSYERCVVRFN